MPRTSSSVEYSKMVGAVLRARRIEAGLTQAEVGERLNVGQSYINRVETGRINMTIGQLGRFSEALGATLRVRLDVPERDPLLDRMSDGARLTATERAAFAQQAKTRGTMDHPAAAEYA